jgi:hypothetical protein
MIVLPDLILDTILGRTKNQIITNITTDNTELPMQAPLKEAAE